MSRVRITIGRALLAGAIALSIHAYCCTDEAKAAPILRTVNASAAPQLLVANTPTWSSDVVAANNGSAPAHIDVATCVVSGNHSADLEPGESFIVENAGEWQCGVPLDFYFIDAPPGLDAFTSLHFNDGHTKQDYPKIPPIGSIPGSGWLRVSPVRSDGKIQTTVTVFPTSVIRVFVDVYDTKNKHIAQETFDPRAGADQYVLATKFNVGSIVITTQTFIGAPQELRGFVSTSAADGSNAVIYPF